MEAKALAWLAAGLGVGITVFGVGTGIGPLVAAALEAGARQPETAKDARTTMIIGAALIEGVALLACVVCILLAFKA
ncbi:MAG: ATP synthase F0 subunit C [Candidatus Kapaibacterium sp.]|jgi:F-type H+-transporting ATPase subunit c|nr:ATP synthase F0 subunit C [Ignavibacteria bacterium]HRE57398.1 ATP synthase F0 subunit C [Candidatus Kapabacteria bacterium]HRI30639.1 ATP synthase F0 subunit C [Candidatus Kapabacteria bacterium]